MCVSLTIWELAFRLQDIETYIFLIIRPNFPCFDLFFDVSMQAYPSQTKHKTLWALLTPRTTKLWRGYRVCPVRMYVSTYVRSFVCSPALVTSFIIQFRYNFTQVLDMTIPRTSSRFSVIGSRSRSQ